jgi:hypothetical protein
MTYLKIKVMSPLNGVLILLDIPDGRVRRVGRVPREPGKVFPEDRQCQSEICIYGSLQSTYLTGCRGMLFFIPPRLIIDCYRRSQYPVLGKYDTIFVSRHPQVDAETTSLACGVSSCCYSLVCFATRVLCSKMVGSMRTDITQISRQGLQKCCLGLCRSISVVLRLSFSRSACCYESEV